MLLTPAVVSACAPLVYRMIIAEYYMPAPPSHPMEARFTVVLEQGGSVGGIHWQALWGTLSWLTPMWSDVLPQRNQDYFLFLKGTGLLGCPDFVTSSSCRDKQAPFIHPFVGWWVGCWPAWHNLYSGYWLTIILSLNLNVPCLDPRCCLEARSWPDYHSQHLCGGCIL